MALAVAANAQLRDPDPKEKEVLAKYRTVVNEILDQFRSDDWDETVDYEVGDDVSVAPNADRPLDVNEMFQRSYNLRPGSQRYTSKILPSLQKLQETQNISEKQKLGKEIQKFMHLRVEVHFNVANVGDIEPPPSQNTDLKIAGAAFAYKTKNNVTNADSAAAILAFGNWQPVKWDAEHGWYHFHFVHLVNTPYIENVVVNLYGASDRIDELLHSIDWKRVNDALTR